jgi:hypothetical protein
LIGIHGKDDNLIEYSQEEREQVNLIEFDEELWWVVVLWVVMPLAAVKIAQEATYGGSAVEECWILVVWCDFVDEATTLENILLLTYRK